MIEKPLNKNISTPLYRQLSVRLADQIIKGEYKAGEKLPSEREFSDQLNVSRITARQAIEALLESGLIYREQGRGTFVAEPRMRHLEGLVSFTEDMIARGYHPSSRVITQELIEADEEFQRILKIDPTDKILHLVRVRLADGKPIALQSNYISQKLCPGIENEDLSSQSLYALLREKYYAYPAWTEIELEAVPATVEEAHFLEVEARSPLLVVRGKSFTDSFEIVESVNTVYRGKGVALYIGRHRLGSSNR